MAFSPNLESVGKLVADAKESGGSERGNYQIFITRLCEGLGVQPPDFSKENVAANDYVFERSIRFNHPDGSVTPGYIDCYKRGHFILEAKQSPKRQRQREKQEKPSTQTSLFGDAKPEKGKAQARAVWDNIMLSARTQAEGYAKALPVEHGYPPFLLIVDVGHVIEVYADFSGQGKNYAHFPDRQNFRITMEELTHEEVLKRLHAIWTDPHSINPAAISAEVTKDVAERLAKIASGLEKKHDPKDVAEFLMRCLFTMFAEDVKLLPDKAFEALLSELKGTPENFVPALESLWKVMNDGGYAPHFSATLKRFNGGLFKTSRALPLDGDQISELHLAARRNWKDVEPAIFGTLLERALNDRERSKLGAHYTPRSYVERLVVPTIIEPLRNDWQVAKDEAQLQLDAGEQKKALDIIRAFHRRLSSTRVLDPACGTGNFLYVSFELMKLLEGEVLKAIADLGGEPDRYQDFPGEVLGTLKSSRLNRTGGHFSVGPHQFFGLELNKRAVPIADLVLWLGYLKWQIRTNGLEAIEEPVLDQYGTIKEQDAILAYDSQEVLKDEQGRLLSRWDGVTKKLHPITGEEIPDPDAQVPLHKYVNPRKAEWPEAEFIVGNPPFIASREMREELGDDYVDAIGVAYPKHHLNIDFVVYFWILALERLLPGGQLGLVSTARLRMQQNNLEFSNAVQKSKGTIVFACPDHKWPDGRHSADVRICMATISKRPAGAAKFLKTPDMDQTRTRTFDDEEYLRLCELKTVPALSSRLMPSMTGSNVVVLMSNSGIASAGVKPYSRGFIVESNQDRESQIISAFANGHIIGQNKPYLKIIDVNNFTESEVASKFPKTYQHLLHYVKPTRIAERNPRLRREWWKYEANRDNLRDAIANISAYIVTLENSPRRYFLFLEATVLPDQKLRVLASENPLHLAVLSGRAHELFAISNGGRAGKANTPVYNSKCIDCFPFPDLTQNLALEDRLRELGERLNALRKERLATYDFLTMTGLYNSLERYRELNAGTGDTLTAAEQDAHEAGLISVLAEIHDDIDRATLSAYGWSDLAPALVGKPGGTVPSDYKAEPQLEAEEQLLSRLVALNLQRAEEEKNGTIRWLRPEYQIPKLKSKVPIGKTEELELGIVETTDKPKWPAADREQIRAVSDLLAKSAELSSSDSISATFDGRNTVARKQRISLILETMLATGSIHASEDGTRYFSAR